MSYALSALWRQSHPGALWGWLVASAGLGFSPYWGVGILSLWVGLGCVLWEPLAQRWAAAHGHRVWFVLPSPAPWVRRRLRGLGYRGPVAGRVWEIHVQERRRWTAATPPGAAAAFRQEFTRDLLRWIGGRPPGVAILLSTFNALRPEEVAQCQASQAWIGRGPLHPRLPRLTDTRRMVATQRRMFGGVVSTRDRTNPGSWTTVYWPPREG